MGRDLVQFFQGARVRCGECGKEAEFAKSGSGGGDTLARQAGWLIQWPKPFVRCPDCAAAFRSGLAAAYAAALAPTNPQEHDDENL